MNNCTSQAATRRKIFWTTQPDACGTYQSPCNDTCGDPGLQLNAVSGEGSTFATNDWLRSLILNIFGTDGRLPESVCGVQAGTQGGHWSESYRTDGQSIGTLLRSLEPVGRIQDSIAMVRARAQADAGRLVTLGVASAVDVAVTYLGGTRVSIDIEVTSPSGSETNRVNLLGDRIANEWVWQ